MAKRDLPLEIIEDICNSYQNGETRKALSKKYNCSDNLILRVLKENNITIRTVHDKDGHYRKYSVNDKYFNLNNQTHNSAYILGLLASDGCVHSEKNLIYIELQRADKEVLEEVNKEIKNARPVKDYYNNSKDYENSKLWFYSAEIKQDLAKYFIIPNKTSFDNDFMQNINGQFYIDYIRGHFDGDGSIKWTNGTITWQIDSTSLKTLKHMQQYMKNTHGIELKIANRNNGLYRIYCYGFDNCLKIFQLFYEYPPSETIRMKRKQQRFAELLMKYKTHETPNL